MTDQDSDKALWTIVAAILILLLIVTFGVTSDIADLRQRVDQLEGQR